jgi:hypothetical protein
MAVIRYRYLHNAPSQNYKQLLAIMWKEDFLL